MTIAEAIARLENLQVHHRDLKYHDDENAIKLGIEALKLYMALKATGGVPKRFSGLGETEE